MPSGAANIGLRSESRRDAAIVRADVAVGVGGVIRIESRAGVEAPVRVQVPAIVDEERIGAEMIRSRAAEDRTPADECVAAIRRRWRDDRIDVAVRVLHAREEEQKVAPRLM